MSKHTPGAWVIWPNRSPLQIFDGEYNTEICTVSGSAGNESSQADARLIATAPDLLEALRQIADHVPDSVPEPPEHGPCGACARAPEIGAMRICDEHYRALRRYQEAQKDAEHAQHWQMRRIARAAIAKAEDRS